MTTSPIRAIREFCLECCGGNSNDVKTCTAYRCPLHAFRFGKNPYIKREMSDEQKEAAKIRLAEARKKKGGNTDVDTVSAGAETP